MIKNYLAYWHYQEAFNFETITSFIQHKDEEGLLKYILSTKVADFPKNPPLGSPEAFNVDYRHSECALAYFANFVFHDILEAYNEDKGENYHSLYFSIVQSSLFGKTRLVVKAGASKLNVAYCCVRQANSSGYPMSNQNVVSFLTSHWRVHELEIFIVCIYCVAMSFFSDKAANEEYPPLSRFETDLNVKFSKFWGLVLEETEKCLKDEQLKNRRRRTFEHYQKTIGWRKGTRAFASEIVIDGKYVSVPTHLLIVFDESRWLLETVNETASIFRNLRKANQNLGSTNCVLVFIDTLSSVSDFQPAWSKDPSHRPTDTRSLLLPPFYEILTADPLGSTLHPVANRHQMLANIFSFGRPGWQALFFRDIARATLNDIERAVYYAKEKLSLRFKAEPLSESAMIAVLAIRFGIIGISDYSLATSLISSHMGTGVYIGEDRLRMTVQYISEPVLAEAACQILHGTVSSNTLKGAQKMSWKYAFNSDQISEFLDVFCNHYVSGLVDVGELGELLARVILSLSYDFVRLTMSGPEASEDIVDQTVVELAALDLNATAPVAKSVIGTDSYFTDSISLKEFFSVLVPESYRSNWAAAMAEGGQEFDLFSGIPVEDLENSQIALTAWIQLASSNAEMFSQENLEDLFYRRCGIILPANYKGIDLVIPTYNHVKKSYSYIAVQVKKKQDYGKERYDDAGKAMSPLNCLKDASQVDDYIGLYMEVDFKENCLKGLDIPKTIELHRQYPRHILLLGTPQGFWSEAVLGDSMKNIQKSNIDYIDSRTRNQCLRRINTVTFKYENYGCTCIESDCSNLRCGCRRTGWTCVDGCHLDRQNPCQNSMAVQQEQGEPMEEIDQIEKIGEKANLDNKERAAGSELAQHPEKVLKTNSSAISRRRND